MKPKVLVVAGLDPSGGAGLIADYEAVRAAGAEGLLCAAAITAQTARAVRGVEVLSPEMVALQVEALLEEEEGIAAIKLGMLGSAAIAERLARFRHHPVAGKLPWVIDPVLRASSGGALMDRLGSEAYRPLFFANAVLTPNLAEAGELAGFSTPRDAAAMEDCGRRLQELGAGSVLVKGGHLEGDASDLLLQRPNATVLEGRRLPGTKRGTGCRLASFLAGRLALGHPLAQAARDAKAYVARYLSEP